MSSFITTELKRYNYLLNEMDAVYHEAAFKLGLSDSAMIILYTVCNHGEECLLNDITHFTGISKQTINSALRKLEADDIIYLKNMDKKKKMVCLTAKGKDFVQHTVVKILQIENEILGSWSEQEWTEYIDLTQRFLNGLKSKVKELSL